MKMQVIDSGGPFAEPRPVRLIVRGRLGIAGARWLINERTLAGLGLLRIALGLIWASLK
jgi:hypothetical protein